MASTSVVTSSRRSIRREKTVEKPLPAELLEFQSPTASLIESPIKPGARSILKLVVTALITSVVVLAVFPVDTVVSGGGRVVSTKPNILIQPLEPAIVREIKVREGQTVHAGDVLARLDPTFSNAD